MTDTTRAAFEAWAKSEGYSIDRLMRSLAFGYSVAHEYFDADTQKAWRGYQAAIASQPKPIAADARALDDRFGLDAIRSPIEEDALYKLLAASNATKDDQRRAAAWIANLRLRIFAGDEARAAAQPKHIVLREIGDAFPITQESYNLTIKALDSGNWFFNRLAEVFDPPDAIVTDLAGWIIDQDKANADHIAALEREDVELRRPIPPKPDLTKIDADGWLVPLSRQEFCEWAKSNPHVSGFEDVDGREYWGSTGNSWAVWRPSWRAATEAMRERCAKRADIPLASQAQPNNPMSEGYWIAHREIAAAIRAIPID